MITYEYECWKCDEWHQASAANREELNEVTELMGVTVRLINN